MLNISHLFILNETLVEELFDVFDNDLRMRVDKGLSEDLEKYLQTLTKKYGVNLEFKYHYGKEVSGKYLAKEHTIHVYVPDLKDRVYTNKIFDAIFHEYAHHVIELAKPGLFNPTETNKDTINYQKLPVINPDEKLTSENMLDTISYATQQYERSQVAFTIAYGIYCDNRVKPNLIRILIESHIFALNKYQNDPNKLWDYQVSSGISAGSQLLFKLISYCLLLYKLDQKIYLINIQNVSDLLALADKYYKRLVGILGDKKSYVSTWHQTPTKGDESEQTKRFLNKILPKRYKTRSS